MQYSIGFSQKSCIDLEKYIACSMARLKKVIIPKDCGGSFILLSFLYIPVFCLPEYLHYLESSLLYLAYLL